MKSRILMWLSAAAVAAGLASFFNLAEYESRGGESAPLFSSFRADPHGAAAFRELLAASGIPVSALLEPDMPPGAGGVMIQVLPVRDISSSRPGNPLDDENTREKLIMEWVRRGNTLILMCRGATSMGREFGISVNRMIKHELAIKIENRQREGMAPERIMGQDVTADWGAGKKLSMRAPVSLAGETGVEITPLATAEQGVMAAERGYGEGKLVVIGSPSPILNGWMDKEDNLEFMLGLAGAGPVYFDEWSHDLGRGGSIIGLIEEFGLVPALLQVMFVLLLYLWSGRGTPGPEEAPERERVSVMEQIDTLGRLYSRALKPAQTREKVGLELLTRAQAALGGHWEDMDQAIAMAPASRRERLEKTVNRARSILHGGKAGKKDLAEALTMSRGLTKEKTNG